MEKDVIRTAIDAKNAAEKIIKVLFPKAKSIEVIGAVLMGKTWLTTVTFISDNKEYGYAVLIDKTTGECKGFLFLQARLI